MELHPDTRTHTDPQRTLGHQPAARPKGALGNYLTGWDTSFTYMDAIVLLSALIVGTIHNHAILPIAWELFLGANT